tara:strand:+ start:425 stop:685 length:261 start_codon:yes stop_codon:yes gene_type:complete
MNMATVNGLHVPDETLLADGFEGALLGFCEQMNMPVQAVYSYGQCVSILVNRDGMSYDEAIEWMEFNVVSAYVGPETPVFVHAYME